MFDGRESSPATGTTKILYSNYSTFTSQQSGAPVGWSATMIQRQGGRTRPTAEEQKQIVDFETKIFTAQTRDRRAGDLD